VGEGGDGPRTLDPAIFSPVLPPFLIAASLLALVMLDALLRDWGCYTWPAASWPAAWRKVSQDRGKPSPYREGIRNEWVEVVKAGIPRAVSVFLPPVLGMTLVWALGSVLALGDLADVVRGRRSLAFVLASLALCVLRALTAGISLLAAYEGRKRAFFAASALALGHDAALALYPIPCSDIRADDVHIALAGLVAQGALTLVFAFSVWRRHGLVPSVAGEPCDG
jgi:hypothetical protein